MATLNLSNVQPDFEGIRTQLQVALSNKSSWKGLLPIQTGQTIIDFVSAVGAHAQMKAMTAKSVRTAAWFSKRP